MVCVCEHEHAFTILPNALQELFWPLVTLFEVPRGLELYCLTECEAHESNLPVQIVDFSALRYFLSV